MYLSSYKFEITYIINVNVQFKDLNLDFNKGKLNLFCIGVWLIL